jgi:hypothetical protein
MPHSTGSNQPTGEPAQARQEARQRARRSLWSAKQQATRRDFIGKIGHLAVGAIAIATGGTLRSASAAAAADAANPPISNPPISKVLLEKSPFVYVSPLLSDGNESSCHAELWYAWIDDSVVVNVASDRWKATALARGLDRARIWVGDHGRWKGWVGRNEAFRAAPHFDARGERVTDKALLEKLLSTYETKYPDEIASWRDAMRSGVADGSRVLIRYQPSSSP